MKTKYTCKDALKIFKKENKPYFVLQFRNEINILALFP